MNYTALLFKDRSVCSANSVQLVIHCEWFYLIQRYFVIDSKNSNIYFRILWMKSRNYTTSCTRPLQNATLTEIQKFGFKKTMEIWRKAKQEAKGNMTKLKTEIGVIIDNLDLDKFRKRTCLLKYFAKSTDRKR